MWNVAIHRDIQTDLSIGRQLMVVVRELQASINTRQTLIDDAKANLKDNKIATVLFFLELQDKDIAFVRDLLVKSGVEGVIFCLRVLSLRCLLVKGAYRCILGTLFRSVQGLSMWHALDICLGSWAFL
ncbi:hypothetical protein Tco_0940625 [Tanacetum coccineum]|uniref:Uncharacterized protein n=1 Tax=Tanacetum coccineum TaxID=301880 RepID=A0ABQ5DNJ4_9ASTR